MSSIRRLNFEPSPADSRDYILSYSTPPRASTGPSTGPSIVDLSPGCTSIKDQGSVGSCTAHSGVALLEYNLKRFTGDLRNDIFSERFTYYTTRVNIAKWSANDDSGAYLRDTLKSLVQFGSCLEATWPYLTNGKCDYAQVPSTGAYQEGLKYQALTYLNIPTGNTLTTRQTALTTLKGLLQNGYPFIGGFTCYSNLYDGIGGNIPVPGTGDTIIGGHAVCFVGYDDVKQAFKFKNSWASSWGDRGYGYLPYQYLLTGDLTDLWTIYTQENNDIRVGITVVRPKTATQILRQAIADGLVAISQGNTPVVPTVGITNNTRTSLRGFFNRIIAMKSQVK